MIFNTVPDDTSNLGVKISSVFGSIKAEAISFSAEFINLLSNDMKAVARYISAVTRGIEPTQAFDMHMKNASATAQKYVSSLDRASLSVDDIKHHQEKMVAKQKEAEIAQIAQNNSFENARSIIKTYNQGYKDLGLSQESFAEGVSRGNASLGKYLKKVGDGKASVFGYTASLVGAKVASIGLQLATTALNMAISGLISLGISWVFQQITEAIEASKKATEEAAKSAEQMKASFTDIDNYIDKINELRESVDDDTLSQADANQKRKELLTIQQELIEKYGKEKEVVDAITASINGESDALLSLKKISSNEWLGKNETAIAEAEKYFTNEQEFHVNWKGLNFNTADSEISAWVEDWIKNHDIATIYSRANMATNAASGGAESQYRGVGAIYFNGVREQVIDAYDQFYDDIKKYQQDNISNLTEKQKEQLDILLQGISDARNSITDSGDNSYDNSKKILSQAADSALRVNKLYSGFYEEYLKRVSDYNNVLATGSREDVESAYKGVQEIYDALHDIIFYDEGNVSAETIRDYFDSLFASFESENEEIALRVKLKTEITNDDSEVQKVIDACENLKDEQNKLTEWGLTKYGNVYDTSGNSFIQRQFGNVNMDKRTIITWSDELKGAYKDALASWNYEPEIGTIDTVFGGSSRFAEGNDVLGEAGIEVAFTPIMLDENGNPIFLGRDTVFDYIESLIDDATKDGIFSEDELINLDAQGKKIGDTFVKGIIAAADESLNYDNNGNHGDIFVCYSDEYAIDIPNNVESSRRDRTIAVGNDSLGFSRQFADGREHNNKIGGRNGAIIENEHAVQ